MRLMRELRKNKKKKGMLALEAAMALLMVVMASYGVAATSAMEFSQMAASRTAKQAEQYAELEADYLRMVGFYHFDDGSTVYDEPHARQNMTKIIGDDYGSQWESKVTHVNDITVDKFTSVKVARIDVYKTGDGDVPRFTLEVPLTSSSGDVPIGGIITWPSDTLPDWFNEDQYLECNGQSFNTSEYPHLAQIYPDGRVPNYSGLFLRGSGSQSFTQNNGILNGTTSTTHSSGAVGTIQGDSTRLLSAYLGHFISFDDFRPWGVSGFGYNVANTGGDSLGLVYTIATTNYPIFIGVANAQWTAAGRAYPFSAASAHFSSGEPFKRYRYAITGDKDSGYSLVETEEYPTLNAVARVSAYGMDSRRTLPTANEFRPINIAVRYFIRGR